MKNVGNTRYQKLSRVCTAIFALLLTHSNQLVTPAMSERYHLHAVAAERTDIVALPISQY